MHSYYLHCYHPGVSVVTVSEVFRKGIPTGGFVGIFRILIIVFLLKNVFL